MSDFDCSLRIGAFRERRHQVEQEIGRNSRTHRTPVDAVTGVVRRNLPGSWKTDHRNCSLCPIPEARTTSML